MSKKKKVGAAPDADVENLLKSSPGLKDSPAYKSLAKQVQKVLSTLTPREEEVLRSRLGIKVGTGESHGEIGQRLAISPERIRQIEAKALRKLKHPSRRTAANRRTPPQ